MGLDCNALGSCWVRLAAEQGSVGFGLFRLPGEFRTEGKARRLARRMLDEVGSGLLLAVMRGCRTSAEDENHEKNRGLHSLPGWTAGGATFCNQPTDSRGQWPGFCCGCWLHPSRFGYAVPTTRLPYTRGSP